MKFPFLQLAVICLLLGGCAKKESIPAQSQLLSTWIELPDNPTGVRTESELVFSPGAKFQYQTRIYGVYEGQSSRDLSITREYQGTFTQSENVLVFHVDQIKTQDSSVNQGLPVITKPTAPYLLDQSIFSDCSYTLSGRRLELVYLGSGPADGPVRMSKTFVKSQ